MSLWTSWHQKGINRSHLWSMFPLVPGDLLFFCPCEAISAFWLELSISSTVPVCQYHPSLLFVWKGLRKEQLSSQKSTEWNCTLGISASLQLFFHWDCCNSCTSATNDWKTQKANVMLHPRECWLCMCRDPQSVSVNKSRIRGLSWDKGGQKNLSRYNKGGWKMVFDAYIVEISCSRDSPW